MSVRRKPRVARRRTPKQLVEMFARRMAIVLDAHDHMAGFDHCLVLIVCGTGVNRAQSVVASPSWAEDEIAEVMVGLVSDIDSWGKVEYPYAANIHELVAAFMRWVSGQIGIYKGAQNTAILAAHPEGAVTISYGTPQMKEALFDVLAEYAQEQARHEHG